jgi:hypothetical protein
MEPSGGDWRSLVPAEWKKTSASLLLLASFGGSCDCIQETVHLSSVEVCELETRLNLTTPTAFSSKTEGMNSKSRSPSKIFCRNGSPRYPVLPPFGLKKPHQLQLTAHFHPLKFRSDRI